MHKRRIKVPHFQHKNPLLEEKNGRNTRQPSTSQQATERPRAATCVSLSYVDPPIIRASSRSSRLAAPLEEMKAERPKQQIKPDVSSPRSRLCLRSTVVTTCSQTTSRPMHVKKPNVSDKVWWCDCHVSALVRGKHVELLG